MLSDRGDGLSIQPCHAQMPSVRLKIAVVGTGGVAESDLALPFTQAVPIPAHGLLRKLAPLMLLVYRRRDAREI